MSESKAAYYQRHKETILSRAKYYCANNKDEIRLKTRNKYI